MDDIDIDDSGGEQTSALAPTAGNSALATGAALCLSCGANIAGVYCVACGQKNDDLRRSIFLLAREFVEDTFSFDSRMWRTLGSLAVAPGLVPNAYSHGIRSRYTPPVRLFLVVSLVFFLILSLTQTLFVALQVTPVDENTVAFSGSESKDAAPEGEAEPSECGFTISMRYLTRTADIPEPPEGWEACRQQIHEEAEKAEVDGVASEALDLIFARALIGVGAALSDPVGFNAAFNNWLPRVLFMMTPIAALIMLIFIRGPDALFFDHLVLSLYSHSMAFAVVGAAVVLTQLGAPFVGVLATLFLFAYLVRSIKRAYGRGWVKTVWASLVGGLMYLVAFMAAMLAIVSNILLSS